MLENTMLRPAFEVARRRGHLDENCGALILAIAQRVARNRCFHRIGYKEDMIGDAVLRLVQFWDRYDGAKSQNIFGYLTKIAYNAMIHKITIEDKQRRLARLAFEEHCTCLGLPIEVDEADERSAAPLKPRNPQLHRRRATSHRGRRAARQRRQREAA